MSTVLHTKFGNARLKEGYYMITSGKEGNHRKSLHRLIWEDFYRRSIPKGYVIHHMNGNPQDNRIQNLQCCEAEAHNRFHKSGENNPMYGKHLSEEHKKKICENQPDKSGENHPMYGKSHSLEYRLKTSKTMSTSGILNVYKHKNPKLNQGFNWKYQYYENGKRKSFSSVDIHKLKKKVISKGLPWIILDSTMVEG